MAADAWKVYNKFKEYASDGTMDLDGDVIKVQLHSSSYTPALTHAVRADLDNELSTANGYTAAGDTPGSVTWTESSGTVTLDSADPAWTASGGSITARYGVAYDDTPADPLDPLIAYTLLDNTPADVTVTDGNTLTIELAAGGYLQVSGGGT